MREKKEKGRWCNSNFNPRFGVNEFLETSVDSQFVDVLVSSGGIKNYKVGDELLIKYN